jgi:hypothetical protein
MWGIISAVIITALLAGAFAYSRFKGKEKLSFILKVSASAGFVITAIIAASLGSGSKTFLTLMFIAISLGFLGDVALGLRTLIPKYKIYFVTVGIVIFLAGHVIFSICYINYAGVEWWLYLVNIIPALLIMSMTYVLKYKLTFAYKILGLIYSYTITLMLLGAIALFETGAGIAGTLILAGGISFYISDCLLSASYFKLKVGNYKILNLIVHITYYLAQILLAFSLFFV